MTWNEASLLQQSWSIRSDNKQFQWLGGKVFRYNNFFCPLNFLNPQNNQRICFDDKPAETAVVDFSNQTVTVNEIIYKLYN